MYSFVFYNTFFPYSTSLPGRSLLFLLVQFKIKSENSEKKCLIQYLNALNTNFSKNVLQSISNIYVLLRKSTLIQSKLFRSKEDFWTVFF